MQRKLHYALAICFLCAGHADAAPDKKILDSCLTTQAVGPSMTYSEIDVTAYFEEDDEDSGIVAVTFLHKNRHIGTWESRQPDHFGLVYHGRKMRQQDVTRLTQDHPEKFSPYLARWAMVAMAKKRYLCVAFNFEGLGQSGSFQNIRGVYIVDGSSTPARAYYFVGDARSVVK